MEFRKILHTNVNRDGTFSNKTGAVVTTGSVRMSKGEGCGLYGCHCSDGYWITICMPLKRGKIEGINITFSSKEEMDYFLNNHWLNGDTNIYVPIDEDEEI